MVYLVSNDYHWKSKKGQSLTEEINGLKRNCEIYIYDFDNQTFFKNTVIVFLFNNILFIIF